MARCSGEHMSLLFSNNLCSAYVAEVVKSFQTLKPTGYLGRTALQKLVYFSKAVGVPVPCSFEIYNFGPYSEEVTRSVSALLADEALQDISSTSKYSSYKEGMTSTEFSPEYLEETAGYRPLIDSIVNVLGDSKADTLELVATLHFVNAKQKGILGARPQEDKVIAEFRSIKGDKFNSDEIATWYGWLAESNLL
jgi:uncharacterized protein YwgA